MLNIYVKGGIHMSNSFMRVDDVAAELGVSKSYAYKIMRKLNTELKNMGYLIVAGRVSKKYFMEKVCYGENENKERK
jgi:Mn-dependent DtxR family transcriptional regulator